MKKAMKLRTRHVMTLLKLMDEEESLAERARGWFRHQEIAAMMLWAILRQNPLTESRHGCVSAKHPGWWTNSAMDLGF